MRVYHGGANIRFRSDLAVQQPKKNRFETGVGINCTKKYETARQYGRYVNLFHLQDNIALADNTPIDIEATIDFVRRAREITPEKIPKGKIKFVTSTG